MAGRKVANADEALTLLGVYQDTEGSLAAFARSRGIDGRSLNAWRINLERSGAVETSLLEFVELVPTAAETGACFQVRCGPFSVYPDGTPRLDPTSGTEQAA